MGGKVAAYAPPASSPARAEEVRKNVRHSLPILNLAPMSIDGGGEAARHGRVSVALGKPHATATAVAGRGVLARHRACRRGGNAV